MSPDGDGFFTGVITATSYSGIDLSAVTGATGDFSIADKIVHTGDTNTAIRFPAADTITAETGGTERLRINSSGNLGLGESSSIDARLHVNSGTDNATLFLESTDGDVNLCMADNAGSCRLLQAGGNLRFRTGGNANAFGTGDTETMVLDSSGRLLIGTTTEGHAAGDNLTVADTGNSGITIRSGTSNNGSLYFSDGTSGADEYRGAVRYLHGDNALQFYSNGTESLRIASNGAVSINYTGTGDNNLHIGCTSNASGIIMKAPGNHYANIDIDANRSGANNGIFNLMGKWNGTDVAALSFTTGSDTTNKDDGYIKFYTRESGASLTERMRLASDGRLNIGGGSDDIKFSGNGITIKGADNTGAAVIEQYTTTAGRGYKQSLVMGLSGVTSHNEVLRITGTGANGFRMLVKIRVVGHTGTVGDGYRISEWYWTGGTNTPASIYNYQGGSVPSLQFDTSNSNIWIIRIGSSNQSNAMNGVVEFDVLVPIDFGGNTWTTTTAN